MDTVQTSIMHDIRFSIISFSLTASVQEKSIVRVRLFWESFEYSYIIPLRLNPSTRQIVEEYYCVTKAEDIDVIRFK